MLSFSSILGPRSSSETARSDTSESSTRSYRLPSSSYIPPSIVYGSPTRPNIELQKPVWEVNGSNQSVYVSGEIEVDVSMFRHGAHLLPFSIGIHFTTCDNPSSADDDSDNTDPEDDSSSYSPFRGEWNQDGPGNYYRHKSFIHIEPRVLVDDICHVNFTIAIPNSLLPRPKNSRIYNVAVKAYELGDPYNVTEPSAARFMVLNRVRRAIDRESAAIKTNVKTSTPPLSTPTSLKRVSDIASQMNIRMMKRGGRYGKFY